MADLPRLNQVIKAFEQGQTAFTTFSPAEIEAAIALGQSKFDGVVYEMEHNFWDARALRDALQFMLNRRQLVQGGSLAPAVTPMVRIPPNGGEHNQWLAKQALDLGVYGVL
jgi:4-hydroxy-2-oxoheptanedioate aldolase